MSKLDGLTDKNICVTNDKGGKCSEWNRMNLYLPWLCEVRYVSVSLYVMNAMVGFFLGRRKMGHNTVYPLAIPSKGINTLYI
jgi:hypothetical protein